MDENTIKIQAELDETRSKKNINASIDKLQRQLNDLKIQAKIDSKAITNSKTLFQYLSEGEKSFSSWLSDTVTFTKVIATARQAINTVKELDTALVDLRKTSQMSDREQIQPLETLSGAQDGQAVAMNSDDSMLNKVNEINTVTAQNMFEWENIKPVIDVIDTLGDKLDWLTNKLGVFSSVTAVITTFVKSFA